MKDMVDKLVRIVYVPVKGNPFDMNIMPGVELYQSLVEGFFSFANVDATTIMAYNDDQWTQPENFILNGRHIRGAVFFIGMRGREWIDCPKTVEEITHLITKEKEVTHGNTV